jgi:predicted nucleotidyltransferase
MESFNMSRDEILKILEQNREIIQRFSVRSLALFGSAARGEAGPTSDLDFLVDFEKKSFDSYMDLKTFLERLFGRPVDLVISDAIKPRLRPIILAEAVHAPGL